MTSPCPNPPLARPATLTASNISTAFETLTRDSVLQLSTMYAEQARFKDPFNEVQGRGAIAHIFSHMFDQVDNPRFLVSTVVQEGANVFMCWDFKFFARGQERLIKGSTHFILDDQGLIALHRDYWDAAQELYETLPILGSVLRWIRSKLAAPVYVAR